LDSHVPDPFAFPEFRAGESTAASRHRIHGVILSTTLFILRFNCGNPSDRVVLAEDPIFDRVAPGGVGLAGIHRLHGFEFASGLLFNPLER
jgi:hypothetical protein